MPAHKIGIRSTSTQGSLCCSNVTGCLESIFRTVRFLSWSSPLVQKGQVKSPRSRLNITTGLTAAEDCFRVLYEISWLLTKSVLINGVSETQYFPSGYQFPLTDFICGCSIDDTSHACTMTSQPWSLKLLLSLTENYFSLSGALTFPC